MTRKIVAGQSLTEYGLIAVLVSVVSISALVMLGQSLSQAAQNMLIASQKPSTTSGQTASGQPASGQTSSTTPASSGAPAAPSKPAAPSTPAATTASGTTIKLADGTIIQLSNYPPDVAKTVQTAGVNGATNILADNITKIAQQLAQSGEITPVQESQLISLSNQAHTMADIEKMVENTLKKNPDKTTLMTTPVTFNNKTYKHIGDLVNEIAILDASGGTGSQLGAFNTLLSQINNSGALADPTLKQLINGLSSNIQTLADQTENTFWDVTNNGLPANQFVSTIASQTTTTDAANICTSGNGTDSGVSCAP